MKSTKLLFQNLVVNIVFLHCFKYLVNKPCFLLRQYCKKQSFFTMFYDFTENCKKITKLMFLNPVSNNVVQQCLKTHVCVLGNKVNNLVLPPCRNKTGGPRRGSGVHHHHLTTLWQRKRRSKTHGGDRTHAAHCSPGDQARKQATRQLKSSHWSLVLVALTA